MLNIITLVLKFRNVVRLILLGGNSEFFFFFFKVSVGLFGFESDLGLRVSMSMPLLIRNVFLGVCSCLFRFESQLKF